MISKTLYAELSKITNDSVKWSCPKCINIGTQSQPASLQSNRSNKNSSVADYEKVKNDITSMFQALNEQIAEKFQTMEHNLSQQFAQKSAETDDKIVAVKKQTINNSKDIANIQQELNRVNYQLHNSQRINNLSCINVYGIPLSPAKNYEIDIIKNIALHYNINLPQKSIQLCYRLGSRKNMTSSKNETEKFSPIMVRFSTSEIADEILQAYFRSNEPLKLSDVSDETIASRVFIGEHLTQHALKIYKECSRLKRRNIIAKVFTRDGNVFISESMDKSTKLIKVNSIDFLKKLFPSAEAVQQDDNTGAGATNGEGSSSS